MKNQLTKGWEKAGSGIPVIKASVRDNNWVRSITIQRVATNRDRYFELYERVISRPEDNFESVAKGTHDYCLGVMHGKYETYKENIVETKEIAEQRLYKRKERNAK